MAERMVGLKAPYFEMKTVDGEGMEFGKVSLDDYKGQWLVLFFYPLDFTFVCPTEITGINERLVDFGRLNASVLGASTDSEHSHKAWINAAQDQGGLGKLSFPLASDMTQKVARDYGILIEEEGIALRGLFIIDPEGILRYSVVHDLNVGRSVEETLRVLQGLQSGGLCPFNWSPGEDML
ncbi:alkyl hydroperoxide reductase/ Thiol specific antioxidant/ Mal allergen [Alkaliphilus metalliredigens QYMF]|uniref:Alkyl hydroperoxide reductase/ Thiol specific antioxidant/ Mal allergen n=1 Tax=Alkaliphilus metalliredigens (strain QYMF) TaxID=293826 RepID=A6TW34_ALKMQ|nr:peroxiredoxin [Alkaliphilus metalliredigens]ABR50402.1 alkyl hydroperoxide reductase/ Thiol specific antioxidant/ Mal allergen [Alkaliphilus metalliredigens QYMF]